MTELRFTIAAFSLALTVTSVGSKLKIDMIYLADIRLQKQLFYPYAEKVPVGHARGGLHMPTALNAADTRTAVSPWKNGRFVRRYGTPEWILLIIFVLIDAVMSWKRLTLLIRNRRRFVAYLQCRQLFF